MHVYIYEYLFTNNCLPLNKYAYDHTVYVQIYKYMSIHSTKTLMLEQINTIIYHWTIWTTQLPGPKISIYQHQSSHPRISPHVTTVPESAVNMCIWGNKSAVLPSKMMAASSIHVPSQSRGCSMIWFMGNPWNAWRLATIPQKIIQENCLHSVGSVSRYVS